MPLEGKDWECFVADCFRDAVFCFLEREKMPAVFFDALMMCTVYHDFFGKVSHGEMMLGQEGGKRIAVHGMKRIFTVFLYRVHGRTGKILEQMSSEIELD